MKWVGRVLLIVLIASTLFVAKQNDFQTETALAQTGSTQNLTLNLNDIEVRVVKRDNSSSTTAGSAVIDSQTTAVYFNKVKVTNNSNQDIYFRITAQLYYGTTPGPCAIAGGISCAPPNQYRIVSAGQTLTLPDNTFLLPSSMFDFLSGQYPFQTLALQGINKADLNFILSESGYASTNVTKAQILKWSAVRIKLQDGAGTPVNGKLVGLFKEGESNTQPPPDQWRSGNTNAAGQAAMALLDPITILPTPPLTYTARYVSGTNPQDYTYLPPPVVVTGPDFQDLTYTICDGGTGGQGFLLERAQAQAQQCLPDLVPDLTGAYMEITLNSNARFTVAMSQLPVGYGTDVKLMTLKNVKIKNIGGAPSSGVISLIANPTREKADILGGQVRHNTPFFASLRRTGVDVIAPGESLAVDLYVKEKDYDIYDYKFPELAKQGVNKDYLYVFVDDDNLIAESNEDNNTVRINNYFAWSTIKAHVAGEFGGGQSALLNKVVAVFRNTTNWSGNNVKYATVGSDRVAYLTPTESIYSGPKSYEVWGQIGGRDATGAHRLVTITNYSVYNSFLTLNQGVMIFLEIFQDYLFPGKWDDTLNTTSGKVTLENKATHRKYDFNSKNSVVFINLGEIPSGNYALISAEGTYSERNGREFTAMPLKAKYPETSRSRLDNGRSMPANWPQNIKISDNGFSFIVGETAQMVLAKGCVDLPRPASVNVCIYGDNDTRERVVNSVLPAVKDQLGRLKGFRSGASALRRIILSPYPQSPGGYYSPGVSDAYFVLTYRASPVQPALSVHEIFHFIEDHNSINGRSIGDNLDYQRSVRVQLSTQTGKRIWDIAVRPDNYNRSGYGYTAEMLIINRGAAYKYGEVFAEEMTSSCLYQKLLTERLTNIESYWRTFYGSQPPSNLRSQRDNALNRIKGIVKDANGRQVTIPQIASYFEQCGR